MLPPHLERYTPTRSPTGRGSTRRSARRPRGTATARAWASSRSSQNGVSAAVLDRLARPDGDREHLGPEPAGDPASACPRSAGWRCARRTRWRWCWRELGGLHHLRGDRRRRHDGPEPARARHAERRSPMPPSRRRGPAPPSPTSTCATPRPGEGARDPRAVPRGGGAGPGRRRRRRASTSRPAWAAISCSAAPTPRCRSTRPAPTSSAPRERLAHVEELLPGDLHARLRQHELRRRRRLRHGEHARDAAGDGRRMSATSACGRSSRCSTPATSSW